MKNLFFLLFAPFLLSFDNTDSTNYISIIHFGNTYSPLPDIVINKDDFVAPRCGQFYVFCYSVNAKNYDDIGNFIKKIKSDDSLNLSGNVLFTIYKSKKDSSQYLLNRAHSKIFLKDFVVFLKGQGCDQRIFMRVEDLMERLGM